MVAADPIEVPVARRRIRPLTLVLLVAAPLVVLLVGGVGIGYLISERKVRAELERIRAAGEPVTPEELEAFYTLPPGTHDSSALWLAAAAAASRPEYDAEAQHLPIVGHPNADTDEAEPALPEPGEPWVYDLAVEQFLFKHADILAMAHEAAALGGEARYPTQADGFLASILEQARLRNVARLLALESAVNTRRGDAHAAVKSDRAVFALGRSFRHQPVLVAELLRFVFDHIAIEGLQRIVWGADISEEDLPAIDHDLAALEYQAQFHRAMLGERVLGLDGFDDRELLGDEAPSGILWTLSRPADRAVYLQGMREFIAASSAPDYPSLRTVFGRATRYVDTFMARTSARWCYPMSKASLSAFDSMTNAMALALARREVARAGIAAERFRRVNGRLPTMLDELVPDFLEQVAMDPFSGGPLHWILTDDEYRVYSVGPDGIDQGGAAEEVGTKGDIFIRGRQR